MKLHWQILLALLAAVAVGKLAGPQPGLIQICEFLGTLFLNALKMIIVPLIIASIISGVSSLSGQALGRIGLGTLIYYLGTGLIAICTGLLLVNLIVPGVVNGVPAGQLMGLSDDARAVAANIESRSGAGELLKVFYLMFPPNIFAAISEGQMLGIVCFAMLYGFFVARLPQLAGDTQRAFWSGAYQTMADITGLIMRFAPIGVFGLVTKVVAQTGFEAVRPLMLFFFTVIAGLAVHALITLPIVLRLIAGVSPLRHFQAMAPALLTAFSTSSSGATLPVTVECMEKRAKVPNRITGFVLPVGANVNTDGSALYECVAAMFIAQAYGVHLGVAAQFSVVLIALLSSIGVAGIPSASLVAIVLILNAVGVPLEGLGLILAVDRVLDMCRTTVNVLGDSVCTVTVARLNGEHGVLAEPVRA
ncbi:Na+/H+-dicarboxylate symporter [Solimonas aquatica]|uniref:Na+/H+-dicarboxylate symporter n=1 Tax=Solimonas aquatica TaxID=489703 RepID=A0A1H9I0D2_9GAMM|nr:dicarboxylate/amino acid:cation symporter [Solimonas aquatica]SEQ67895.1 Na+/H+-dicarboxylate symporter [Solimonas aquatica]